METYQEDQIDGIIEKVKCAQEVYSTFTQEQVDKIFKAAANAAQAQRIPLATMAVEETGMGIKEDKVIKNQFASEFIYNKFKDTKTCDILERDFTNGTMQVADPIGIIAGIVPTTNPTSTIIFKSLLALKTRNGIVFSPHPRAKNCSVRAARIVLDAAVEAGAPEDIISCIEEPSIELTNSLIHHPDISLILATGGPGMVKAAYSSGTPAIGVGAGNTPVVIDEHASIKTAISSILMSKTFDNGVICASEQSVTAVDAIYEDVKKEFGERGAYILNSEEKELVGNTIMQNGRLNPDIVGQSAHKIASMAGINVPQTTKVLVAEVESTDLSEEPFANEKLSPTLALYWARDYKDAIHKAESLISQLGAGHTAVYYTRQRSNQDRIEYFGRKMKTGRILINMPTSQGAIGDIYNFKLSPSLTLGCGSWGGNSVSENIGVKHLLNIKTVAGRRENMLWLKVPKNIYFKYGCLELALSELSGKKRAFVVTDKPLYDLGIADKVTSILNELNIETEVFYDVEPDPTLSVIDKGVERMKSFGPDAIIAVGGGSPIDAAKIMWLGYEHPEVEFEDIAQRFMDIRKRIMKFPEMGIKATFVAIPTTSGTGSEVTPFAVVTDDKTGIKYPLADYELTPHTAIIDPELVLTLPKSLVAFGGIDALTHAIEAYVSIMATDYTDGLALQAIKMIFENLPNSYIEGADNFHAKEKMHNASTIAGMAFANAFLGICHSMAHKLGGHHHLPHGLANGLLINEVIKYNATDTPTKQAAFSQYKYPSAKRRYAEISETLNLGGYSDDDKVKRLIEAIDQLKYKIDIPASIQEAGIDKLEFMEDLDQMTEEAFDDQCTGANPRYPLMEEIKEVYMKAFNGK